MESKMLCLALFLCLACGALSQTTFTVQSVYKTAAHPNYNKGYPEGYTINGKEGPVVTLMRGVTYTFVADVPEYHPFYISTSADGSGAGEYLVGVTGSGAHSGASLTFTPDQSTPNLLYYQCTLHSLMGWKITITNRTFVVTAGPKTVAHPYYNVGNAAGYKIDGVEGPTVVLERGATYRFLANVTQSHPFYISTDPVGASAGEYLAGVWNSQAFNNTVLTFTPGPTTPRQLWYQCTRHLNMGWKINITTCGSRTGVYEHVVNGVYECVKCPAGTFQDKAGAKLCKPCPAGTYSSTTTKFCSSCPAGTYSTGAASSCTPCPAGTYASGVRNWACIPCPVGTSTDSLWGQSACTTCPAGVFGKGGTAACNWCAPGTYGDVAGAAACKPCPYNTYTNTSRALSCQPCPAGTYALKQASTCSPCPSPRDKTVPGSVCVY